METCYCLLLKFLTLGLKLTTWIKYAAAACSEPAARLNLQVSVSEQIHSLLKPEVDPYRAQNPYEKDLMELQRPKSGL